MSDDARIARAVQAYADGGTILTVTVEHRVSYKTLRAALSKAGVKTRKQAPKPGPRKAVKVSASKDYVPGRIKKPCVRCREKPSGVDSGGLCGECSRTPICRCAPGIQRPGNVVMGTSCCSQCRLQIYPYRPSKRSQSA